MNALACQLLESAEIRFIAAVDESQPGFGNFAPGKGSRSTLEIINHLVNVLAVAEATLTERERVVWRTQNLDEGISQFRFVVNQLRDFLENNDVEDELLEVLIHGPISDVFGHIGQLVLMRVMSGKPVKRVDYMKSPVSLRPERMRAGRVAG